MKCIPITLSGRLVDDAISSIDMLDVLVASMAVSLHIRSNSENADSNQEPGLGDLNIDFRSRYRDLK